MDSPSLDSPPPPVLSDQESAPGPGRVLRNDVVLIADFGNAIARDYAAFVSERSPDTAILIVPEEFRGRIEPTVRSMSTTECLRAGPELLGGSGRVSSLIVFIGAAPSARERRAIDDLLDAAHRWPVQFIGIVSSFRVHLNDQVVMDAESEVRRKAEKLAPRVIVFRPGHVLSPHSDIIRFFQRFAPWYPLVPKRIHSCFIEGARLFDAIEKERLTEDTGAVADEPTIGTHEDLFSSSYGRAIGRKKREFTLLGSNVSWREMLSRQAAIGHRYSLTTALSIVLSWLLIGEAMGLVFTTLARFLPNLRPWSVKTLTPRSRRELLSLCHEGNINDVKVVGYNNGVHHFGHRYPGKTIVSTLGCHRAARTGRDDLKADCGLTIRSALDYLAQTERELFVVPNYSYVCLGTSFFVPIHGSAIDYSTVAATIRKVVLYDPCDDRIISAERDERAFRDNVYHLQSRVIVLRVYLLTKPKTGYFVVHETLHNPNAIQILDVLADRDATNVEIRQAQSRSEKVTVSRYYQERDDASTSALELPRDTLGRLWDRLEENPITAFLMHAVGRHLVWHAELFFRPDEFARFWETHSQLPLRKIQLRTIRRDGLPHSPFREEDCVSADLFMFRRNKRRFQDYLQTTLPTIRTNPGKHSQ